MASHTNAGSSILALSKGSNLCISLLSVWVKLLHCVMVGVVVVAVCSATAAVYIGQDNCKGIVESL